MTINYQYIENALQEEEEKLNEELGRKELTKKYPYIENYSFLYKWNESFAKFLSVYSWNKPDKLVRVYYLSPERAFQKIINPMKEGRPDIPIISFIDSAINFDQSRGFLPALSGSYFLKKTIDNERWAIHYKALPYTINYQVWAWSRTKSEIEFITYQIISRFQPVSYIYVDKLLAQLELTGITSESETEYGEGERIIVQGFSIDCHAWIPLPNRIVGKIKDVQVDIDAA